MEKQPTGNQPRRRLAYVNMLGITQLHLRNPYIIAFWSAMFPGFGHLLMSRYVRAIILFIWEVVINLTAHVNLALFFTLLGDFDAARDVVDIRFSLLYIPTYAFAIWDSYRVAVDMNKQYILASRENAPIKPFVTSAGGVTFLDKRSPVVAAVWCGATPGLGHIMLQRILHGVFVLVWWILFVYYSNLLTAVHYTFFGEFLKAREALNPQWFLNLPSLFFFCVYTTYVNSVETNKLYDIEQAQYLKKNFQSPEFLFPAGTGGKGDNMYVVSVFKQSVHLELAVTALQEEGLSGREILAVPVEKSVPRKRLFDTMYSYTGDSVFDLPMILGALATFFGCVYGFKLFWGPVLWGIITGVLGFCVGLAVKVLLLRRKKTLAQENEVVIFVACDGGKTERIKQILQSNGALGVSAVKP